MVAVFKTITPTMTVGKKCPHNICAMFDTSIKKKISDIFKHRPHAVHEIRFGAKGQSNVSVWTQLYCKRRKLNIIADTRKLELARSEKSNSKVFSTRERCRRSSLFREMYLRGSCSSTSEKTSCILQHRPPRTQVKRRIKKLSPQIDFNPCQEELEPPLLQFECQTKATLAIYPARGLSVRSDGPSYA